MNKKKWILRICGLVIILLVLKAILFVTAKPKITVDYVAEYNRTTIPKNYDPNENAADDYKKAFGAYKIMPNIKMNYIEMPEEFNRIDPNDYHARAVMSAGRKVIPKTWPIDFNNSEQDTINHWLASNKEAFEYFRTASNKPYYWLEGYVENNYAEDNDEEDNYIDNIKFPETGSFKIVTDALIWNAKFQAFHGKYQLAFEDILACYRAGQQKCRTPSFLSEQLPGIRIKREALTATTDIIYRGNLTPQVLSEFQNSLKDLFAKSYTLDFEAEKLKSYDKVQRGFVYSKKGNGRIACRFASPGSFCCGPCSYDYKFANKIFLTCLFGPTRNEVIKKIEEKFTAYESAVKEKPSQLHSKGDVFLQNLVVSHCEDCRMLNFDEAFSPEFYPFYNAYHHLKAQERASLTIIALHRFKTEKGKLPEKLDELVSEGYLQTLPLDPYSDGSLVYRVEGKNFTLYSVGENFKDDGGKEQKNPNDEIIFWPVKRPENKVES